MARPVPCAGLAAWTRAALLLLAGPTLWPAAADPLGLQGAGSTLAYGLYSAAALAYSFVQPNVTVTYAGYGSGRGKCRIENATRECATTDTSPPLSVDFAGSDAILTASDYAKYPDLQMYPTAATAVVPIFNLGPTVSRIVLTTTLLAQIYEGTVTYWGDSRITALNPNLTQSLPAGQRIILVVRSDSSGTTEIFKKALASFDPGFQAQVGTSSASVWPGVTAVAQSGNQGVVAYVMNMPYALGYSELGVALANDLSMVTLKKYDGAVVEASVAGIEYAVLQLGLSFGNNNDDPAHLTADLQNAAGPNAWPIVGYTYLLMRKNTLRIGATCETVRQTVAFWYWFWTSDLVANIALDERFSRLPGVVRDAVVARFVRDVTCGGEYVYQQTSLPAVMGTGTSLLQDFFNTVINVYSLKDGSVNITYAAADDAGGQTADPALASATFGASIDAAAAPPPGGFKLLLAGAGAVAITPINVTLDGPVLAQILEGTITTWLDSAILRLNPGGVYDAAGNPITNASLPIRLLRGPFASGATLTQLMRKYLPTYTGAAMWAAPYSASANILRYNVLGNSYSLGVTTYTGSFPAGLQLVPFRRSDSVVVAPSWQAIKACATDETFDPSQNAFHLQDSSNPGCYPLALTVQIRVRKSQCSLTTDAARTQTVRFVEWLFTDPALPAALEAAALAPLLAANAMAALANQAVLDAITCDPKATAVSQPTSYTLIIALVVGVGGGAALLLALLYWRSHRGMRDNSTAPKNSSKPFAVLFTDIESSTHLWATCPAEMAQALDVHHALIRQLIGLHRLYEVKTIGDSFMCATPDPARAVAFAVALQQRLFDHAWGLGGALDDAYAAKRRQEEEAKRQESRITETEVVSDGPCHFTDDSVVWNGLRVRVGIHYGLGEIKLDPVSKGYDYYGTVVNTAARIESVCHGGQIAVSREVHDAVAARGPPSVWTDLGPQPLRGLAEPVQLYEVLPAGLLSQRRFPPLRLEKAAEVDAEEREDGKGSCSMSGGAAATLFNPEVHPLVRKGLVTAAELQQHYSTALLTLLTLLATQAPKFKETTLKGFCKRLKVAYAGSAGAKLTQTLHGLVMRVLPATVTSATATDRRSSNTSISIRSLAVPHPRARCSPSRADLFRSPRSPTSSKQGSPKSVSVASPKPALVLEGVSELMSVEVEVTGDRGHRPRRLPRPPVSFSRDPSLADADSPVRTFSS